MNVADLLFDRPRDLEAREPPESRGIARDGVRLLVSDADGHADRRFRDLPDVLRRGDLLIVNRSQTLASSLPAVARFGAFRLNLSTDYGRRLWLVEPRWNASSPGPLPIDDGESLQVAGVPATVVARFPGAPRLLFVQFRGDLREAMRSRGSPIRYGYVPIEYPLATYQTVFGEVPGSAEMPSAGRPFTPRVVEDLTARGIQFASVLLHTGVSSLELEGTRVEENPLIPEPFEVPPATVRALELARRRGGRVIAVGTSVVRALESAWDGGTVRAMRGFTRAFIRPPQALRVVDALLTGLHDPRTSHLAMLFAVGGVERVREAYRTAIDHRYRWHEFGDSHLLFGRAG